MNNDALEALRLLSDIKDIREQLKEAIQFAYDYHDEAFLNYLLVKNHLSSIYSAFHEQDGFEEINHLLHTYLECWEDNPDIKAILEDVMLYSFKIQEDSNINTERVVSLAGQDLADYMVERYSNGELGMRPMIFSLKAWLFYKLRGKNND